VSISETRQSISIGQLLTIGTGQVLTIGTGQRSRPAGVVKLFKQLMKLRVATATLKITHRCHGDSATPLFIVLRKIIEENDIVRLKASYSL